MNPTLHIKARGQVDAAQTVLLLIAGDKHLSFALMNHAAKEIVEFGYYALEKDTNRANIFEQNKFLSQNYYQSVIAYHVADSVLVPAKYFSEENAQLQLETVCGFNDELVLMHNHLPDWNLFHVYGVPASLHAVLSKKFEPNNFININSVLLNNFSGEKQEAIRVDFRTDEFSVLVFKNNLLQLVQSFAYGVPEDVLYSLLKICRQFNLSQQEVKMYLAGLIEKDSSIYRELYKYFIHLEFEELPAAISIAPELKVHPSHYYSTISKLASCVS